MAETSEIPATASGRQALLERISDFFEKHSTLWICILLLLGFAVRRWRASGTYLNPDEAMHLLAANQTSWRLAYQASLGLAHPPLLVLLLHGLRFLGTSEIVLRMPSILAGTAFCWLTYKWASMLFGRSVVWIVLIFTLFLPSTIDLSAEVRQYTLLLAFAMASAYLFERALETNSASAMLFSGVSLWLAICSHYSALLFAAAMGIYEIFRMMAGRPSPKVSALWVAGQVIAIGLGAFFYVSHISRLSQVYSGSSIIQSLGSPYLPNSYYVPGKINPLLFIFARTGGVFQFAFAQLVVGDLAYAMFLLGIFLVLRQPSLGRVSPRQLGLLLLLPFAVGWAAALTRIYPYGGTRHSAFLLPFALAGVGFALAHLLKYRLALGIAVAIAVALFCNLFPAHRQPYISRADQSSARMNAAVEFMRHQIAPDEIIFADSQTGILVEHYLCDQQRFAQPVTEDHSMPGFISFDCGGHRVVVTDWKTSFFTPRSFYDQWQTLASKYDLQPGARVWIAQMGWSTDLAAELEKFPEFHLAPHFFGNRIQIFDLTVGQSMPDPKLLPTS